MTAAWATACTGVVFAFGAMAIGSETLDPSRWQKITTTVLGVLAGLACISAAWMVVGE